MQSQHLEENLYLINY